MESACRKWGARRFRISLRIKGLGARKKVGTGGSESATQGNRRKRVCRGWDERMKQGKNQEREQKRGTRKKNQEKEKPPASIEGNLILAGGKILRLRSE